MLWAVGGGGGGKGGLLKEVDELTGSVRLNTEHSPTRLPEAMVLAEVWDSSTTVFAKDIIGEFYQFWGS
jgi:hypothetical protein